MNYCCLIERAGLGETGGAQPAAAWSRRPA